MRLATYTTKQKEMIGNGKAMNMPIIAITIPMDVRYMDVLISHSKNVTIS